MVKLSRYYKNFDRLKIWELVESFTREDFGNQTVLSAIDAIDEVLWGDGENNINAIIRRFAQSNANKNSDDVDPDLVEEEMRFYMDQVYINPHVVLDYMKTYNKRKRRYKVVISLRSIKAVILEIITIVTKTIKLQIKKEGLC